jgi:hypothetical protein
MLAEGNTMNLCPFGSSVTVFEPISLLEKCTKCDLNYVHVYLESYIWKHLSVAWRGRWRGALSETEAQLLADDVGLS